MAIKKMKKENVLMEIEKINKWLLSIAEKWFDFQFSLIQDRIVKLEGSFDLTTYPGTFDVIEIEFVDALFIKTILFGWQLQKEKPFLGLTNEDESLNELKKLQERGKIGYLNDEFYTFKINTDREEPVLIMARGIKFSVKLANDK